MRRALKLAICLLVSPATALAASCSAANAGQRIPLVELFTSEGCSSCPPADRWLSSMRHAPAGASQVTALAYHVDYWDYIGWKDRFAVAEHGERHARMVANSGGRVRYTPQVFVNGEEYPEWRSNGPLPRGQTAGATIKATTRPNGEQHWQLALQGSTHAAGPFTLTLAMVENGLSSQINAGENRGRLLAHDFVVRSIHEVEVRGPEFELEANLSLPPEAEAKNSSAVIVVRNRSGEVLQSLGVPLCMSR